MTNQTPTQKAHLLFDVLDDLPLEGYEASFKMMRQSFSKVRFLIGVKTKYLIKNRFDNICNKLAMPDIFYNQCMEKITDSNTVLFGFEEDVNHCIYKIYLEFSDKNKAIVQQTKSKTPLIQYIGFKWDAFNTQKAFTTIYKWFPFISTKELFDRIHQILKKKDYFQFVLMKEFIELAISRSGHSFDPYIYLEANDMNSESDRKSLDLNFYQVGLKMLDVEAFIIKMMHFFEIPPQKWDVFLRQIRRKVFGHMSGGYNSSGQLFFNVYYDVFSCEEKIV